MYIICMIEPEAKANAMGGAKFTHVLKLTYKN